MTAERKRRRLHPTLYFTGDALLTVGVGLASAVIAAIAAGVQSYFSMISKDNLEDYGP